MKRWILHRSLSVILCVTLLLSLAACSGQDPQPEKEGTDSTAGVIGGRKGQQKDMPEPEADSGEGAASLLLLRDSMAYSGRIAGAVAYLGYREQGDTTPLADWLRKHCPALVEELPFLLEIPAERTLGPGYGDVYCVVPRDENTSLTVTYVTGAFCGDVNPTAADQVLYQEEHAGPVLLFVNYEKWREEPDMELTFLTADGVEVTWWPMCDENDCPILPLGADDIPMLMDFEIFGVVTGLDYPADWGDPGNGYDPEDRAVESPGYWQTPEDCGWLPPTDWGLAYTSWICEHWIMDISWGDSGPNYSGLVELYYQAGDWQEYTLAYSGVWRMEGDCLRLELYDGAGVFLSGNFPVLIAPSGEYLHMQKDPKTHVCPPFFAEGMTCADLILTYG